MFSSFLRFLRFFITFRTIVILLLSMVVVALLITTVPTKAQNICDDGDYILLGKYWLNSNLSGKSTGSGSQCMWDASLANSTIAWGTSWKWNGRADTMKSYDSAVLGWHWGSKNTRSDLPVQLSQHRGITTSWNFSVKHDGINTINVAYDIWLHTKEKPEPGDAPSDEVMVWLYQSGSTQPVGTKQATVTIAGTTWDLWRGSADWNVSTFVRTSNTTSASLNLTDFFDELVTRNWLSTSEYVTGIGSGVEVYTGNGRFDTTAYSVVIEPPGSMAPVVNITNPTPDASFTAPTTITIEATANDSDGTITRVEFYNGETLLGTVPISPYRFVWSNVPVGNYTITARAYDNNAISTISLPVNITVSEPPTPTPTPTPTHEPPTPTPTPVSTRQVVHPTPTQGSSAANSSLCQVQYTINQWDTGFTTNLVLTNLSQTPINGWTLTFSFSGDQRVVHSWNANFAQQEQQVSASNLDYNATLHPGSSAYLGFNGSYSGQNSSPTAFALNGTPCSIIS